MQDYLVHIIFVAALIYIGWTLYKNRSKKSSCEGCESCRPAKEKKSTTEL